MANILIAWQEDASGRLPTSAVAVGAGARTVRAANTRLLPLEAVGIDQLFWCDGLVMGVHSDPWRVADALERWRQALEPRFWEAVQGKFASVFVAAPDEARKRECAHDCAVRLLTEHGMLVTEFIGTGANTYAGVEPPRGHFHREYERLGRLSTGMVHAWIDRAGNPHRRRVLGSLVRATRRVSAMRPGDAATDSAASRYGLSGLSDGMTPITESGQ